MLLSHRLTSRVASRHAFRFQGRPHINPRPNSQRTLVTEAVQRASDGFLDLALALPFPEAIPPYSGTIILLTVATRLFLTVPFSIWAKTRQWKTEEVVVPQLMKERPAIFQRVHQDMKREGFKGTREEAQIEHAKRAKPLLKARQKELCKENNCSVLPTMLIPPVTQLPLFVGLSMVFGRASVPPTVLDSEAFFTLTSLSHADPTVTLPIILGVITFANVDASRWFMTPEARLREQQVAEWTAKRRAAGETVVEPKRIFQSTLRIAAVGRILFAALVPGSIQLYWAASAAFGLIQTWVLDWWDHRRRLARRPPTDNAEAAAQPSKATWS